MDLLKLTPDSAFGNDQFNGAYEFGSTVSEGITEDSEPTDGPSSTTSAVTINTPNSAILHRSLSTASHSSNSSALFRSGSIRRDRLNQQLATILEEKLDLTRISDRLLVASRCWHPEAPKDGKNSLEDLATFLNQRYRDKYLIWNVGSPETAYPSTAFNNRVITATLPRSQHFTLKGLFHLCHSIYGWLQLFSDHVAIIQCNDGRSRSSLLFSCLLRFARAVENTFDALEMFWARRICSKRDTRKLEGTWNLGGNRGFGVFSDEPHNTITKRYLRYFNDLVVLDGRCPNDRPINLHQVIITGIPNFDGLGGCNADLELFQDNVLLYSTEGTQEQSIYMFQDDNHIIFRLTDNCVSRDLHLNIFHSHPQTRQRSTILSVAFNTAFIHPGVVRLRAGDLEMPFYHVDPPATAASMKSGLKRFGDGFCLDLIIYPTTNDVGLVNYHSATRLNPAKNLLRLSQMLPIKPDRDLCRALQLQANGKFYARFALQLSANDIHQAHEFLAVLPKAPLFPVIDTQLKALFKTKKHEQSFELEAEMGDENPTVAEPENIDVEDIEEEKTEDVEAVRFESDKKEELDELPDGVDNEAILETEYLKQSAEIEALEEVDALPEKLKIKDDSCDRHMKLLSIDNQLAPNTSNEPLYTALSKGLKTPLPSYSGIGIKREDSRIVMDDKPLGSVEPDASEDPNATRQIPPPPPLPVHLNFNAHAPPPPPPLPPPNGLFRSKSESLTTGFGGLISSPPSAISDRPKIKNSLHWNEIRIQNLEDWRGTVWHDFAVGNFSFNLQWDKGKFEELFCVDSNERDKEKESRGSSKEDSSRTDSSANSHFVPIVIDIRRANNVGIGLARFLKRFPNHADDLISALYDPKEQFTLDDLTALKSVAPSEEEGQALRLIKNSDLILMERMGKAEKFLHLLATRHQGAFDLVIVLRIFELSAPLDLVGITEKLKTIMDLLGALRHSKHLKMILKGALEVGNLANYEYGRKVQESSLPHRRGSAHGFTLDSLCRLHEVKSVDGGTNLLVFLAITLLKSSPEIQEIFKVRELQDLEVVKGWSANHLIQEFKELQSNVLQLKAKLDKVIKQSQIVPRYVGEYVFLDDFSTNLQETQDIVHCFNATWQDIKWYFGEDLEENSALTIFADSSKFFGTIWQFLRNFEVAVKEAERREKS